jgi:hypothetical protein
MFLIDRDYALPEWLRDRVLGLGPLHRPRGERERHPVTTGLVMGAVPGK